MLLWTPFQKADTWYILRRQIKIYHSYNQAENEDQKPDMNQLENQATHGVPAKVPVYQQAGLCALTLSLTIQLGYQREFTLLHVDFKHLQGKHFNLWWLQSLYQCALRVPIFVGAVEFHQG